MSLSAGIVEPAAGATSTPGQASPTYTVRRGDTLYGIARRFGVPVTALAAANHRPVQGLLLPGQVLTIPGAATGVPTGLPDDLLRRPDALALVPVFRSAAAEFGVPADLLMSLAYRESGWHPEVRSPSGAIGIGQLLPGTAAWVATSLLHDPALDPELAPHNIRMTAGLLRWMLDRFGGDVRLALAAYAVGAGAVARTGVSPEVDRSLQLVLARRAWFA